MRLLALVLVCLPGAAHAFCGFYVSGAGAKLWNEASQVVLVRSGSTTVLSMQNHYDGPPQDFAMVVPVPVVLKKEDVKTLPRDVFANVDKLSAPRLVEYWEQDPCQDTSGMHGFGPIAIGRGSGSGYGVGAGSGAAVTILAQFTVGEYDIVILSARDSTALDVWLKGNGYKIPAGAEPYLRPYVAAGMKFFVAKVDASKVQRVAGRTQLSPLRVAYTSDAFSLPIRLGTINSRGVQDLLVYLIGDTRYELANRPNATIPTNLVVKESVKPRFSELYTGLFDAVLAKQPGAAVTEYAWAAQSCDPCPGDLPAGLPPEDLMTLGGDIVSMPIGGGVFRSSTGVQVQMGSPATTGSLDKMIIRRYLRQRLAQMRYCYEHELVKKPSLAGTVNLTFTIDGAGKVARAEASGVDAAVSSCIAAFAKQIVFPKPPTADRTSVRFPLTFVGPPNGAPATATKAPPMSRVVLTRLHLRYGKDGAGDDLVFRAAKPLVGGGGLPDDKGQLAEKTATVDGAGSDRFQGRYVILHPWTGKLACQGASHGAWGGPPAQPDAPPVAPARDLAFVPRGKLEWRQLVLDGLPAGL